MKDRLSKAAIAVAMTMLFTSCQSREQSMDSAYVTCANAGIQPGSWQHERCTRGVYEDNRRKNDQAATAVAVGVAAGAVGAYALSEASKNDRQDSEWRHRHRPRW